MNIMIRVHVDAASRNEGRPFQGIDTTVLSYTVSITVFCRNEGRPFQGIDTALAAVPVSVLAA